MRTKLALIALSSFAVAGACLGGAFALAANQMHGTLANFGGFDSCEIQPSGQSATRRLAWDGSDHAGIAVPANVHYRRGQGDQLVVSGDSALLPHIEIVDGSVQFDCRMRGLKGIRLDVTLPGRDFRGFSLAGSGDINLEGINQPDLSLHIAGAGKVIASGKVENLELHIAGAGDARLASLAVDRVAIHVAGSGNIDVAPKDDLDAHIVGSGTVMLHSEPRSIETHIIGSGRIVHPDGSISGHQHI
jgi:hypothetical protein